MQLFATEVCAQMSPQGAAADDSATDILAQDGTSPFRSESRESLVRLVGRKGLFGCEPGEVPFVGAEACSEPPSLFFPHSCRPLFRVSLELEVV